MARELGDRTKTILEMASRPEGVTNAQVSMVFNVWARMAGTLCSDLVKQGKLWTAKPIRAPQHYFTSQASAKAWLSSPRAGADWTLNLPGTPKYVRPKKPVTHHTEMKHTVAPGWTHDPRFQCAPGEQPEGAGFAAEWRKLRG